MVKKQRKIFLFVYILVVIIHSDSPNSFIKTSFFLYHLPTLRKLSPLGPHLFCELLSWMHLYSIFSQK